jgi:mannose/cellobiose epimerase-like protein (N-acyl-D-glucosamine 2-epimerase family)
MMTFSAEASRNLGVNPPLLAIAGHARSWLFDCAAHLWRADLSDETPLFPERLSIRGETDACPRRLFVQARHVFSYCELGRIGWSGPWREMVGANIDFLIERGRRSDGFYIHRFDHTGAVSDARADLYDQAFILLALAYAGRALDRPDLFRAAGALGDVLQANWRLPNHGYYEGEIAVCPPFRQNPHMHLLEAFVALHAATGAPRWRRDAEHIARLCARSFLNAESGALLEYFDADLAPVPGKEGSIVEPGHCFEWAWLFERLAEWGVVDSTRISDRLTGFSRRYGLDVARGVAVNEVLLDGSIQNPEARLWPQTERLKAALARYRRTRDKHERAEAAAAYSGLIQYFETPAPGAWRDKLKADGSWVDEPSPGSSMYHITCALAELLDTVETDMSDRMTNPTTGSGGGQIRQTPLQT